ncbi:hydrogen peroxide-dependent heme synthase [Virgibacillus necropolis]|uniref:Coproheme decarboxylase n=1 Tax=Virgibacillus necropolis TaxID=163877 RepID=A0A221M8R7_9BACI|nr:hydrogen peroxide-dependent heme synthase [Virgibacillus necropolis]ASN04020.1 heme-dependent peroxidase [Virgibacillus necropolis]
MAAAEAVETMDGWYCLHDLRSIDWASWKMVPNDVRQAAIDELHALLAKWDAVEEAKQGSHVVYTVVGQKADIMMMILRPTMDELNEVETAFNKTKFADFLLPSYSYVSVVELSKYFPQKKDVDPETLPETQARLKPILPKWDYISFYPMNKRRAGEENWYALDFKNRAKLLYEHSKTGRKYAGRIKQIITGSFGFDDWEWGVTLFAHDAIELKRIVYEMRFDEVSAKYGEFGEFFVGNHLPNEKLAAFLQV